jgi:hypothetical protein
MKTGTPFQKIIAVLMIFILMIIFSGCYSTQVINTSQFLPSDNYYIHSNNSTYKIDSVSISNEILAGKIVSGKNDKDKKNKKQETLPDEKSKPHKNHIYLSSGSGMEIENGILKVPVISIVTIQQKTPDPKKTTGLIIGCSAITALSIILTVVAVNATVETGEEVCGNW